MHTQSQQQCLRGLPCMLATWSPTALNLFHPARNHIPSELGHGFREANAPPCAPSLRRPSASKAHTWTLQWTIPHYDGKQTPQMNSQTTSMQSAPGFGCTKGPKVSLAWGLQGHWGGWAPHLCIKMLNSVPQNAAQISFVQTNLWLILVYGMGAWPSPIQTDANTVSTTTTRPQGINIGMQPW